MTVVTFYPSGRTANVQAGTSLLDAAGLASVEVTAPCGGEGGCGECRVQVKTGAVECVARGCLSAEELQEGWVLACSARVTDDVTVYVSENALDAPQIVTGAASAQQAETTGSTPAAEPTAVKYQIKVEAPSPDNSFSDFERVARALRATRGMSKVVCGLGVLHQLAAVLRRKDHEVTVTMIDTGAGPHSNDSAEIVRIEAGNTTRRAFGLAIDIGTTTCAAHLVDLTRNHIMGTAAEYNGQLSRGLDIISRINYAKLAERREELRRLVLGTLNGLIQSLCRNHTVETDELDNVVIAGNTTMLHLLLGLDPEYIRLAPYTPTINHLPLLKGKAVGLLMNPEAFVGFAPGVGSYVGGDITAGLLQSALGTDSRAVRLFLDIGTNGEVVAGNGEWLMACAASAGPAFEGSGVSCGMRAAKGAIERARIDPQTGRAEISVIGGGKPRGVCGSGLVDLLAEMWVHGILDPAGKLNPECAAELTRPTKSRRVHAYVIVPEAESATGEAIVIDELDIQNLLRTKAAVYSACSLMLKSVGLDFSALAQVYVAGGFGRFLDLKKSILIGMLPDLPLDRYVYLGNSALAGARAMLTSAAARRKAVELANRITYLELNVDPSYMDEYTAALFLPHTDINRFPTARAVRLRGHRGFYGTADPETGRR